ncbi:MAG TPA: MarR family winged helix-turn-helix transcriptional regulator [Thermomicrobiaceae bacterium]|nr:MarR family winged helix-turn-helix transcriptional regulator [Thermomicrobiaceae bacterium]
MQEHDSVSIEDYQKLAEIRYQIRRFVSFSERAARGAGLEPRQYQLMLAVKGLPDGMQPTIGVLAERLKIQHHSAVELVNRLADRGLVVRQRGEADRRQVFVELTDQGQAELRALAGHHLEEIRSIGPELMRALNAILREGKVPGGEHE